MPLSNITNLSNVHLLILKHHSLISNAENNIYNKSIEEAMILYTDNDMSVLLF